MKTKEELNTLKEEVETVSKKLHELTDDELAQVTGGRSVHPDASASLYKNLASEIFASAAAGG